MKKKLIISFMIVACLCVMAVGCGKKKSSNTNNTSVSASVSVESDADTGELGDRSDNESEYTLSEILSQKPIDQMRLLINNSLVPESEANASQHLTNLICERITYTLVSEDSEKVTFDISYPDVAVLYRAALIEANEDTSLDDIYNKVSKNLENGSYETVAETITLSYAEDKVALIYDATIANALTGGLYNMFMEEIADE